METTYRANQVRESSSTTKLTDRLKFDHNCQLKVTQSDLWKNFGAATGTIRNVVRFDRLGRNKRWSKKTIRQHIAAPDSST